MTFLLAIRHCTCSFILLLLGAVSVQAEPTVEPAVLQVLNRLSYGPGPGDLQKIADLGVERYIDQQLHPETIQLPMLLTQQLDSLSSTHWHQGELIARFREAQLAAKTETEAAKAQRRELIQRVALEAGEARMLRALQSPRQLEELMVDFWFNHFNVFSSKGLDRVLVENYEREAIRPYAMGRFRELLGATAHHPAMLFYLDNWMSASSGYQARKRQGPRAATGLNENYARELMELHTLGVDGGYSQRDVTELARILTGWTINPRKAQGPSAFFFDAQRHDVGDKVWLGRVVPGRGQAQGEWALDVLAAQPATARHISRKLAQYFVADVPPEALVERLSQRFLATDGDIRAVLKTLFDSAEFKAPSDTTQLFKTPYRFVVSAVRASGLTVTNVRPLLAAAAQMGMPLYGCPTPDGYKTTETTWLNPDAMTRRINFATALASGKLPLLRPLALGDVEVGTKTALQRPLEKSPGELTDPSWLNQPLNADMLLHTLTPGLSGATRLAMQQAEPALQAAVLLGSPDFMRH